MNTITVQTSINAAIAHVWECFTMPSHITQWNFASPEWECRTAENNLIIGGKFNWRMQAKDGSVGFNFSGTYTKIDHPNTIHYTLDDNRKVEINFISNADGITNVIETFEAETENSIELQQGGWQAILDNFKKQCEL